MSKIISFINYKGGVAKTTSAINSSAILAYKGYSVLLVDLDHQSSTTSYYKRYDKDAKSIYDVMINNTPVSAVIKRTDFKNLDILPATLNFSRADLELSQKQMRQEYALKDALLKVKDKYDYIIIDCPPAENKVTINALTASNYIVMPTIPDAFAVESIISMSEWLNKIKSGVNPNLEVLGLLITIDEATNNKKAYKEVLLKGELLPCFDTVIRKNTRLAEAINVNLPIHLYDKNCNGTKDYMDFTNELLIKTGAELMKYKS